MRHVLCAKASETHTREASAQFDPCEWTVELLVGAVGGFFHSPQKLAGSSHGEQNEHVSSCWVLAEDTSYGNICQFCPGVSKVASFSVASSLDCQT